MWVLRCAWLCCSHQASSLYPSPTTGDYWPGEAENLLLGITEEARQAGKRAGKAPGSKPVAAARGKGSKVPLLSCPFRTPRALGSDSASFMCCCVSNLATPRPAVLQISPDFSASWLLPQSLVSNT